MKNIKELEQEIRKQARASGLSPEEYLQECQQATAAFSKALPELLEKMVSEIGSVRAENELLTKRINMGCRRTYGSF